MSGEELQLETEQGRLAGLSWRRPGAPRVLAIHGWLDNAASFAPLADEFDDLDLVALDLPGHGHSEHRHPTTRYHFIDYLFNLEAALDALGWDQCHLLGHSLGAAISSSYAAGAPERVRSLVLLDALAPISSSADQTADRLRRSLAKHRRGKRPPRCYESIEAMMQARQAVADLSGPAARLICERASIRQDDGFTWRSDPALNWVSALIMTDEQAMDLLRHIECPVLALAASEQASWASLEKAEARKKAFKNVRLATVQGHHHFHMEAAASIAGDIQSFIKEHDHEPDPLAHQD